MSARLVTCCDLCGGLELDSVLDLGSSPPTCNMPFALAPGALARWWVREAPERRALSTPATISYPLALLRCQDCGLVMLSVRVDANELFPADYPYSSGNSRELHDDFAELAEQISPEPDDLLVDIGANDGTLLSKFDCRTIGVEPTAQAEKIGGEVYREPFTEGLAHRIVHRHGTADFVTACNVLAHVPDIGDAMRGIRALIGGSGTLYAENQDLVQLVDGAQWDNVYHEHLRFFDARSFGKLLSAHGLEARSIDLIPTHGGSFRISAKAGNIIRTDPPFDFDFAALQDRARRTRSELRADALSHTLVGIGATARATTVINYCGLDVEDIAFVAEVSGSDKIGRLIPGTRIPVVDEAALLASDADAILFSWHLAESIVPALRARGFAGRIFAPLPHVQELG